MDFEGWEILPEDGYPEIQYDGGKKIFSRKYGDDPNNLHKNNYFICPSQDSSEWLKEDSSYIEYVKSRSMVPNQLLPVPIQLSPSKDEEVVKDIIIRKPINNSSSASLEKIKVVPDSGIPLEADHDQVSQVFFKKIVENKSVDMKMDSPKSNNKGFVPQFENKANPMKEEALEYKYSLPKSENENIIEIKKDSGGLNIWSWSLNGFGAICSFGVVAASICIILLGRRKQNKQLQQQNQKLQFQIFAEDKRIKQVVQHATRLNEAISTMRGVSGVRAHITYGGHYEGL